MGGGITLSVRALSQETAPIPEAIVHLPSPEAGEHLELPAVTSVATPDLTPRSTAPGPLPEVPAPAPKPAPADPLPVPTYTGTILVDANVDITLHCSDGQHTLFQRRIDLELQGAQSCALTSEDYRGEVSFRGPSRYRCWPEQRSLICGELAQ